MRLLRHTGVYGLWLHQAKPTSDQGEDLSLFSSLRGGPAPRAMEHLGEYEREAGRWQLHTGEKSVSEEPFEHPSECFRVGHVCLAFEGLTLRVRDARGNRVRGPIEGQDPARRPRWARAARGHQGRPRDLREAGNGWLGVSQAGCIVGERVGNGLQARTASSLPPRCPPRKSPPAA